MREQIKKFCILRVKMEGFKKFKEPYEVKLDKLAYISGGNGQGKTTIADAIAYAFSGSPFWGEHSADRLRNPETDVMSVEVEFVDGEGELHTLIRRKQGEQTTITFDTLPMRQQDITEVFAEKNIFLSILNPLYFIEKISEKGGEFLQKLLPRIKKEEVLAMMSESGRTLLEKESFEDTLYFVKTKKDELKEVLNKCSFLEGQIATLKMQHKANNEALDDVIKRGEKIVPEKEALEKKQYEGIDIAALKERQAAITKSISGGKREALLKKQAEIQSRQYISKCSDEIAKANAELTALRKLCDSLIRQAKEIQIGTKCPTCLTVVTQESHNTIVTELKKRYDETVAKGKEVTAIYQKLLTLDEESKKKFEEFKSDDLKKVNLELQQCSTGDLSEIAMLEDQIRLGNLSEDEFTKLTTLRVQADSFAKEVEVLSQFKDIPKKISKIAEDIAAAKEKEAELVKLMSAVNEFAAKRAQLSLQPLKMNRAAIKLFDVVKTTGEIKDDFKFTYDGRDYRWLSASEKIKAGLEVSNLLARLTGLQYPTFIDNAECITTKLDSVNGQILLALAKNGELTVFCPNETPVQMKEAA